MELPKPQRGLVISYSYLWHHEYRIGLEEGRKNRPCVIVLAVECGDDGTTTVAVAPVSHIPADDSSASFELPAAMKRHLGLDDERSWVILDEINQFAWPGFDLRPVPGTDGRFEYGLLPPRLFEQLMIQLRAVWNKRQIKSTARY